jgi:hypothetical protein
LRTWDPITDGRGVEQTMWYAGIDWADAHVRHVTARTIS